MLFKQSAFQHPTCWFKIVTSVKDKNLGIATNDFVAEKILERISSGEQAAVNDCLDQYGGLVWSLAKRMLPDKNDAEDAVQEIFIEVWRNANRFDETKSSETTFIAMIARRRLIDRLRKTTRQPNQSSLDEMIFEPTGADGREVHTSIEAKRAAIAMNELRPEQRNVLQLSIVEGYSHSEISEVMGIPLGTVKTHARRGLMEVRNALEADSNRSGKEVSA